MRLQWEHNISFSLPIFEGTEPRGLWSCFHCILACEADKTGKCYTFLDEEYLQWRQTEFHFMRERNIQNSCVGNAIASTSHNVQCCNVVMQAITIWPHGVGDATTRITLQSCFTSFISAWTYSISNMQIFRLIMAPLQQSGPKMKN